MKKEKYWCKSLKRLENIVILEIYLGEDGLYRVYENRKTPGFVFGSLEAIKEKYPMVTWGKEKLITVSEEDFGDYFACAD